jgi:hypothetical protein
MWTFKIWSHNTNNTDRKTEHMWTVGHLKCLNINENLKVALQYFINFNLIWAGSVIFFNATFNNISVISWRSVLLVEETGENHRPVASDWQTLSHNVVSCTPRLRWIRTHNVSVNIWTLEMSKYKWTERIHSNKMYQLQSNLTFKILEIYNKTAS